MNLKHRLAYSICQTVMLAALAYLRCSTARWIGQCCPQKQCDALDTQLAVQSMIAPESFNISPLITYTAKIAAKLFARFKTLMQFEMSEGGEQPRYFHLWSRLTSKDHNLLVL
jgi:hypothetical protein